MWFAGGAPQQEAACAHVTGKPGKIADTLKAKHGIVDIEGIIGTLFVLYDVAATIHDDGFALVDTLQHLPVLVLSVVHELIGVLRTV